MLRKKITNPWLKFRLLKGTCDLDYDDILMAIRYIVSRKNAFKFEKLKVLQEICDYCPEWFDDLDTLFYEEFLSLVRFSKRYNEMIFPSELDWVKKFMTDPIKIRLIEKEIYRALLQASSHWDKLRHESRWCLSEAEKLTIAKRILREKDFRSKRRLQIAEEFSLPKERHLRDYFLSLLMKRKFGVAEKLEVNFPDIAEEAIIAWINIGELYNAITIARSYRRDLIEEITLISQDVS